MQRVDQNDIVPLLQFLGITKVRHLVGLAQQSDDRRRDNIGRRLRPRIRLVLRPNVAVAAALDDVPLHRHISKLYRVTRSKYPRTHRLLQRVITG